MGSLLAILLGGLGDGLGDQQFAEGTRLNLGIVQIFGHRRYLREVLPGQCVFLLDITDNYHIVCLEVKTAGICMVGQIGLCSSGGRDKCVINTISKMEL